MNNSTSFFYALFFAFVLYIGLADAAFATTTTTTTDTTEIEKTLCRVLNLLTGTIGKAIAGFAIIFIGVSLFMGKVSWGLAISTAMGIGAIFGAAGIVNTLSGSSNADDCSSIATEL